jgi:hypothetical protein
VSPPHEPALFARGAAAVLLALAAGAAPAQAQSVKLQLESRDAYAGLPFVLAITAEGFEEEPAPEPPELSIEGCRVWFLGASPSVASGVRIVNGRMTEWRQVTFVYRYRVEAPEAGTYTVPAVTVAQDAKRATTHPAKFAVKEVASTPDMKLSLALPDRPVWIGETFEATLDWLLRREVGDHDIVVPLFDLDQVQVQPGHADPGRTLKFNAGALTVELPFTQERVTVGGVEYTRLRFHSLVTVNRAGLIDVAPAKVAANLEAGSGRDVFGFRVPRYQLFQAQDKPRKLNVRPLPLEGRPDSFENAIGTGYSIAVQAGRTVVQVGDPIELRIRVRGDGPLEGLSLPRLEGEGGLPADRFSVVDDTVLGQVDAEGGAKTFEVTVRVKSAGATEIPALAFSYFDPAAGTYRTIHSEPIALSVAGSAVVGADDVASAAPRGDPASAAAPVASGPQAQGAAPSTLVGADLSLSAEDATLRRAWSPASAAPWVAALYALGVVVLSVRSWQVRTSGARGRMRECKQALRRVEAALDAGGPARDTAPRIVAAVRALAQMTGREEDLARNGALERLETGAFDPAAGERPLQREQVDPVRALVRSWVEGSSGAGRAVTGLLLAATLAAGSPGAVRAAQDAGGAESLQLARESYRAALEESDRVQRARRFAEAERGFAGVVARHPASPDLLADQGNAALGSQDLGRAVLAYRRALCLDPRHDRARKNLTWIRARMPAWLPRPAERGVLDSLFFWHRRLSVAHRHLLGAAAFAAGLALAAPWSARRTRLLRRLALAPLLLWIALSGSALVDRSAFRDAVVVADGTALRSADSLGAPLALADPLPAGTEVRLLERRAVWTRVSLADGTRGWVASSSLETVAP